MEKKFDRNTFGRRLKSMLKVDFRRIFTMPLLYIMVGISFAMPVLILVMTTMMDGSVSVSPQTGVETVIEGFDNTWQAIGAMSGAPMSMDLVGMCNINMLYFFIAPLVGLFVSQDFRSGFSKNLFTHRAKKSEYVISKTLVCFVGSALMLLAYFVGTMFGGAVSGLPFDTGAAGVIGIVMCMAAKILLALVFVAIDLLVSVTAKQKTWIAIVGSLCAGMLLFTMVPMITPLDSTVVNVTLCFAGGLVFSIGLGAVGNRILNKTSLV
ncbi:MAG: ABC transporter permease [Clostridia bacterium]|nr:ABC transporter permease [Clostridia bacterium]